LVATCSFTFAWYALVPNAIAELVVVLGTALLVLLVAAVGGRLPFWLRASIAISAPYLPSAAALTLGGFAPNPFLGLCMVTVSGTLLFGRRTGLVLLGFMLLTIALSRSSPLPMPAGSSSAMLCGWQTSTAPDRLSLCAC
jgi:hypothetical protein